MRAYTYSPQYRLTATLTRSSWLTFPVGFMDLALT